MKPINFLIFLAILALPLFAGCSSILAPRPDPTKYYVLTARAGADPSQQAAPPVERQLAIGLGPVKFPDYLENLEVVTRVAPNQLELSPTARWAGPLDESFRRVLALNLATLPGTDQVTPYPWYASTKLNYRIEVTVERFERDRSGGTQLVASWIIRDGQSDRPLLSRQSTFNETGGAPAALGASTGADLQSAGAEPSGAGDRSTDDAVAALSRDLGDLSKQLADAITALQSTRPARTAPPDLD